MKFDDSLWLVFVVIGLMTVLPRASFILLGSRFSLPPKLEQALRYAPAAALAAIVAPDVLVVSREVQVFNPKLAAAIAAAVIALYWRNPWLPFIGGMGVLLALRP
jgi:branched-subunit amino acid transport protein